VLNCEGAVDEVAELTAKLAASEKRADDLAARIEQERERVKTLEAIIVGRITYDDHDRWQASLWDEAKVIFERRKAQEPTR
jgi:hypothetical protein